MQPCVALLVVEMVTNKAGLLVRKAQVAEQFAEIVSAMQHAKLAEDAVLNQRSVPPASGVACG